MPTAPVRDPLSDPLIAPQNAALLLIDYQPAQLAGVRSMDRDLLVKNAVSTVRTIKTFGVPVRRVNRLATRQQPKENTVLSISTSVSIVGPKRDDDDRRSCRGKGASSVSEDSSRAVWLPQARSYLRHAGPLLARLIADRPDFAPRPCLA